MIAERFMKMLKSISYKRRQLMIAESHIPYLNKLVDQYNNTYYHSTKKKPINAD